MNHWQNHVTTTFGLDGTVNAPTSEEGLGRTETTGPGIKLDAGKPSLWRGTIGLFPRALREVAAASDYGASKYSWDNWTKVPEGFARYSDALVRHLAAESTGEASDPDSGLLHAASVARNALA